jgi:hypothetical protein
MESAPDEKNPGHASQHVEQCYWHYPLKFTFEVLKKEKRFLSYSNTNVYSLCFYKVSLF